MLAIANELLSAGQHVELCFRDRTDPPDWYPNRVPIRQDSPPAAASESFDLIYFSHAFLIPETMSFAKPTRPVFFCQAYESFLTGATYHEMMTESEGFGRVMQMPISIITNSRATQTLLNERHKQNSYYVPPAVDSCFSSLDLQRKEPGPPWRILMVGDYLAPVKGMSDGFAALARLSRELPIQAVLVTQQDQGRSSLSLHEIPVEIHYRPNRDQLAEIYAGCDIYCCPSWYEAFGLPAFEAASAGTPTVVTRNHGILDYGTDGIDVLLCEPNDPGSLYSSLKRLINDQMLYAGLQTNGRKLPQQFTWRNTIDRFLSAQSEILNRPMVGADEFPIDQMKATTTILSREQLIIPIEILETVRTANARVNEVCSGWKQEIMSIDEGSRIIQQVLDELGPIVQSNKLNEAHAHRILAIYDLCRLILSIKDDRGFLTLLDSVM